MEKSIDQSQLRISEKFTEDLYSQYIDGNIKFSQIALLCGVYPYQLQKYFKLNNLKYRQTVLDETTKHNFFDTIDSEIKAYLLGFYLADGSMDFKNRRISLSVTKSDEYIVDLFRKYISPYYKKTCSKSYTNKKTGYTSKPMVGTCFKSNKICEVLTRYGMGANKTYSESINVGVVPNKFFMHFLRGYFDGDGCVCVTTGKREIKGKKYTYNNYNWSIISNTNGHLTQIKNKLISAFNIHANIIEDKRGHFLLEINKKHDFFKLRDLLYKDSNFALPRKKEKYMAIPC